MMIGNRQRYRDLTVALFAELPAILLRYTDRVLPLLGAARVIDDPHLDRPVALHRGQHKLAHLAQHLLVRPLRLADKMQQRLVLRRHTLGRRYSRHWLNALALAGHHQTYAIIPQRCCPIRMPEYARKSLDISGKSRSTVTNRSETHASLQSET